jgi:hypothetical protein
MAENADKIWEYSDSGSGLLWKIQRPGSRGIGNQAGGKQLKYYSVRYKNKYYFCHHIIWSLFNGLIPESRVIDHIDRNGHNNRIENLSIKTSTENSYNNTAFGQSCYKGISWFERDKKWLARLGTKEGYIFLGYHEDPRKAAEIWDVAAKVHGRKKEDVNFPELYEVN